MHTRVCTYTVDTGTEGEARRSQPTSEHSEDRREEGGRGVSGAGRGRGEVEQILTEVKKILKAIPAVPVQLCSAAFPR